MYILYLCSFAPSSDVCLQISGGNKVTNQYSGTRYFFVSEVTITVRSNQARIQVTGTDWNRIPTDTNYYHHREINIFIQETFQFNSRGSRIPACIKVNWTRKHYDKMALTVLK